MKKLLSLTALALCSVAAMAQNPLVTHLYTADPTARVFDGKLYVFPSCDGIPEVPRYRAKHGDVDFCMPGYHAFSLENGSTWKDYGWILKENDVPWGVRDQDAMWAPDCIEKDGKYYYFFPAQPANDDSFRRIGMGVSDNPTGPFKWEKNYIKGVKGIDPGLFVDSKDNQAYLCFGGGQELYIAPLSADMKRITKDPIVVEHLPAGYKEGSFMFERNGVYYFTFAHVFPNEGYTIGYATSDSPMGPYTYRGKIMNNINNGTNHHSVVEYNGQWILFYHYWHLSGMNKLRSMCADYMEFNKDGSIKVVTPTLRGIGSPTIGDTIQIDRYNAIDGAQIAFVGGGEPQGWMVCETAVNSSVTFNDVDFGDGSATKMLARIACGQRTGFFEVRDGDVNGTVIAKFPMSYTGGWDSWTTQEAEILAPLKGKHNICVVFRSIHGATKVANVNWLMLQK